MSVTFTKLFSSITESTIWYEPDATRLVWITMLAMADKRGRVWASIPGLSGRARVPVDSCREALKTLLSPDPDSRTKDWDGCRIEEIDGGWRLLNYAKYRAVRDEEERKAYKAEHERRRRERLRGQERGQHGQSWTPVDTMQKQIAEKEKNKNKNSCPNLDSDATEVESLYAEYPRHDGKRAAIKAIRAALKKADAVTLRAAVLQFKCQIEAEGREKRFIPLPATWFNGERWRDEGIAPAPKIRWKEVEAET